MSKYNLFNFYVASILQLSIPMTCYVKYAVLKNTKQKKIVYLIQILSIVILIDCSCYPKMICKTQNIINFKRVNNYSYMKLNTYHLLSLFNFFFFANIFFTQITAKTIIRK